jgi:hypothetical protein
VGTFLLGTTPIRGPLFIRALAVSTLLSLAVFVPIQVRGQLSTDDHLAEPGWWPTHESHSLEDFAGAPTCGACHKSIAAEQETTPMARTLVRAEDAGVLHTHRQMNFHSGKYDYRISLNAGRPQLSVTDGSNTATSLLLWAFGTGEVGQSYIVERNGRYFESRVSYFSALENLNFTPGRARLHPYDLEEAMERPVDKGEIRRCFGCHSTASVVAGKFEPDKLSAGIACEACHGPGAEHTSAMQATVLQQGGGDGNAENFIFNPGRLSPSDSVDFCGACHGTWVDIVLAGTRGLPSVRAQPYRLHNSKCWGGGGDPRITCVACHDPHVPLVQELSAYDEKCLKCHLATRSAKPVSDHPGAACPVDTKNCASCHMPRIEVPVMHRAFVDHQIRIVRPGAPLPD